MPHELKRKKECECKDPIPDQHIKKGPLARCESKIFGARVASSLRARIVALLNEVAPFVNAVRRRRWLIFFSHSTCDAVECSHVVHFAVKPRGGATKLAKSEGPTGIWIFKTLMGWTT